MILMILFTGICRQIYFELHALSHQSEMSKEINQLLMYGNISSVSRPQVFNEVQKDINRIRAESKSWLPLAPDPELIKKLVSEEIHSETKLLEIVKRSNSEISKSQKLRTRGLFYITVFALSLPIGLLVLKFLRFMREPEVDSNIDLGSEKPAGEILSSPLSIAIKAGGESLAARLGHDYVLELQGDDQLTVVDPNYSLIESAISELVRNAIQHGGRSPVERESLSKPIKLKVFVSIEIQDRYTKIIVADDGEGIDEDKVISRALEKGVINEPEAQSLKQGQGVNLILHEGFSDSTRTRTSRRECGCLFDVYRHLQAGGGELSLRNRPGAFTEFTLHIPH